MLCKQHQCSLSPSRLSGAMSQHPSVMLPRQDMTRAEMLAMSFGLNTEDILLEGGYACTVSQQLPKTRD